LIRRYNECRKNNDGKGQHRSGKGANYTKRRLPIKLVYSKYFTKVSDAFYREKQIQGWSRKKKEALIEGKTEKLPKLSQSHRNMDPSSASGTIVQAVF